MTTVIVVVVVVIVLAALVGGGLAMARARRTRQLREQFGPEYDRMLDEKGDRREAERALTERREHHRDLDLKPLDPATHERYQEEWRQVQRSFVDDPGAAVDRADGLVESIMRDRGYPADDADGRSEEVATAHPRIAEHYREARRVHDAHRRGSASTEDLRGAVTSYRDLVEALLDDGSEDDHDDRGRSEHRAAGHRDEPAADERRDGSRQ